MVEQLGPSAKLTTVEQFHCMLKDNLLQLIGDGNEIQFGYMLPDHGLRGKQRAIENEDVITMYNEYKSRKCQLWMKSLSREKRKRDSSTTSDPSPRPKRSSYDSHLDKMTFAAGSPLLRDFPKNGLSGGSSYEVCLPIWIM